jgi:small-conductance mechanosensitive channel
MRKKIMIPARKDLLSGVLFSVFGLLMLVVIIPALVPVSFVPPGQISPRFLPKVICGGITFFGLLMLLLAYVQKRRIKAFASVNEDLQVRGDEQTTDAAAKPDEPSCFYQWAPLITIGIIAVYFFLLIWIGFIPSSMVAVVSIMIIFGERRWCVIGLTTVLVPTIVWLFAAKLLHIPMP